MSELIIHKAQLTNSESRILLAKECKQIKEYLDVDLKNAIWTILKKAYILKGHNTKFDDSIKVSIELLTKRLLQDFKYLTIEDIDIAVENGCLGLYTQNLNNISIENIYGWVKQYNDSTRSEAISKDIELRRRVITEKELENERMKKEKYLQNIEEFIKNRRTNKSEISTFIGATYCKTLISNNRMYVGLTGINNYLKVCFDTDKKCYLEGYFIDLLGKLHEEIVKIDIYDYDQRNRRTINKTEYENNLYYMLLIHYVDNMLIDNDTLLKQIATNEANIYTDLEAKQEIQLTAEEKKIIFNDCKNKYNCDIEQLKVYAKYNALKYHFDLNNV